MKKTLSILAIAILLIGIAFASKKAENKISKKKVSIISINGIVLDINSGEALAGVKVVIAELDQEVYTDLDGKFEFENVTKDTYHIKSEMISYEKKNLKVDLNDLDDIQITMENK